MSAPILELRMVNVTSLPDGGPVAVQVAPGDILEAGRDSLGWNLPDPSLWISGRHFEMRFENGAWMLYDLSRNGTFLNGASARVRSPCRVQPGDRLQVGQYTILVDLRGQTAATGAEPGAWRDPAAGAAPVSTPASGGVSGGADAPRPQPGKSGIWSMRGLSGHPDPGPRPESYVPPAAQGWPPPDRSPPMPPAPEDTAPPPPGPYPNLERSPPAGPPSAFAPAAGAAPDLPALHDDPAYGSPAGASRPPGAEDGEMAGALAVLEAIGAAAGLPAGTLTRSGDPAATADEIGRALRVVAEDLASLLQVRAMVRRTTRSARQTMIEREHNNPLKFMPTPDEAMDAMFGPPRPGYMRGAAAIRAGFADLQRHQYATQAAIPRALERLLDDLAPEAVERRLGGGGLFGRKAARAWETYVERWDAKVQAHDNGMLDVFMAYFADAYDQQDRN